MEKHWTSLVDDRFTSEHSILLRYHAVYDRLDLQIAVDQAAIEQCSIKEGARVLSLADYRGVQVSVCDESSLMTTGTYKDLDACMITSIVKHAGIEQIVVSSGGNLGYALSRYGSRSGVKSFFFHPKSTLYKLDRRNFDWGGVRLICTDLPEKRVKSLALAFAKHYALTHVPDIRWRLAASAARALFLLEATEPEGHRANWIAQAMCAGYGPAGIYNCFSELARDGYLHRDRVPKFFGFQQEANAPMVRAWQAGDREIMPVHVQPKPEAYIEPGLYNTNPERNYTRLFDLMRYYGGDLADITHADYERYSETIIGWFRDAGLEFTRQPETGEILEKTGLLTGVGILKAIDAGRIAKGQSVLYLMTGGFRRVEEAVPPTPDTEVDDSKTEEEWVLLLGERFGLKAPTFRRRSDKLFK